MKEIKNLKNSRTSRGHCYSGIKNQIRTRKKCGQIGFCHQEYRLKSLFFKKFKRRQTNSIFVNASQAHLESFRTTPYELVNEEWVIQIEGDQAVLTLNTAQPENFDGN
jgi:hypothetical protein